MQEINPDVFRANYLQNCIKNFEEYKNRFSFILKNYIRDLEEVKNKEYWKLLNFSSFEEFLMQNTNGVSLDKNGNFIVEFDL